MEKGTSIRWKITRTTSLEGIPNQRLLAGQRLVTNNIEERNNLYMY